MFNDYLIDDPELRSKIKESLLETWFSSYNQDFLKTKAGLDDIDAHVFGRYNQCVRFVVPWVNRQLDIKGKDVIEVGCGTGSSTAAFAHFAKHVHAYEIREQCIKAARARLDILGLDNVTFHCAKPGDILGKVRQDHPEGADIFLLYAVLEHLTIPERIEMIRTAWGLLRPGGLFVVAETPNRLAYWDHHTSSLPFFHMLPDDLAMMYYNRSQRTAFVDSMELAVGKSHDKAVETRARWGVGASYHEFQVALGDDLGRLIISDGYEPEILEFFGIDLDEKLLQTFFLENGLDIPVAFARSVLNIIFRKDDDAGLPRAESAISMPDRGTFLTNFNQPGFRDLRYLVSKRLRRVIGPYVRWAKKKLGRHAGV